MERGIRFVTAMREDDEIQDEMMLRSRKTCIAEANEADPRLTSVNPLEITDKTTYSFSKNLTFM